MHRAKFFNDFYARETTSSRNVVSLRVLIAQSDKGHSNNSVITSDTAKTWTLIGISLKKFRAKIQHARRQL